MVTLKACRPVQFLQNVSVNWIQAQKCTIYPILGKHFFLKKGLHNFFVSWDLTAKNQKKVTSQSWEKDIMNGHTNRWTYGHMSWTYVKSMYWSIDVWIYEIGMWVKFIWRFGSTKGQNGKIRQIANAS